MDFQAVPVFFLEVLKKKASVQKKCISLQSLFKEKEY